jgi:hypothetical protein
MSRIRMLAVLTAIASLALTGAALAAVTKVTGGTTTVTISSAVSTALMNNHLTVTPLAPATATDSTFTFPISGGRLNKKLHGHISHRGGFAFSNGTRTERLRRLTIISTKTGVSLFALVHTRTKGKCTLVVKKHVLRCHYVVKYQIARIARITAVTVSNGSATGTVRLTEVSADVINRLAGKQIASAGTAIGTATISPTTG